jgi:hypothetical protein
VIVRATLAGHLPDPVEALASLAGRTAAGP